MLKKQHADKDAEEELRAAAQQVELAQLKQRLLLAGRQAAGASSGALDPAQSALVPLPDQAQGSSGSALEAEVAALKALLADVTPQLQELAGMKQQMGQLLSLLQHSTAGE